MIKIILETAQTSCFVAPQLCEHLRTAGLNTNVGYQWKIYDEGAKITTHLFDEDGYYRESDPHQDFIRAPHLVVPAYSIKDVEKALPSGYLLTYSAGGKYEASLSDLYKVESCVASRLPDAFGGLLLQALRARVVNMQQINMLLQSAAIVK